MKALVESLSLSSGAVLIAILSAVSVWFLCAVWPRHYKAFWVMIAPLALSNCLYWSQAWLDVHHGSRSQYEQAVVWSDYRTWALLFIGAWFLAGAIPSAAVASMFLPQKAGKGRDYKRKRRHDG
jgi:hypothetical protein